MKSTQLAAALVAVLGITFNAAARAADNAPAAEAEKPAVKTETKKHKAGKRHHHHHKACPKECEKGKEGSCKGAAESKESK